MLQNSLAFQIPSTGWNSTLAIATQMIEGNNLTKKEIHFKSKSPAEVFGEKVIAPVINKVSNVASMILNFPGKVYHALSKPFFRASCPTKLVLGAAGSVIVKNPLPIITGAMSCASQVSASKFHEELESRMTNLFNSHQYFKMIEESDNFLLTEESSTAYYYKGIALKQLGYVKEAAEAFNSAKKIDSQYDDDEQIKEFDCMSNPAKIGEFRKQFLVDIQMNVPNHYEYGAMSLLAYYDKETILNAHKTHGKENEAISNYWKKLNSEGWNILQTSEEIDNDYYGIAFKNDKTKQIIIAHRGSANLSIIMKDIQILGSHEPEQYIQAKSFTEKLEKEHKNFILSHAGHSFGGVLGELLAYRRHEVAITIDTPGIKNMVKNKSSQDVLYEPRILTYLSSPNVINTCGEHIGERRWISGLNDKPIKSSELVGEALWSYLTNFFIDPSKIFFG